MIRSNYWVTLFTSMPEEASVAPLLCSKPLSKGQDMFLQLATFQDLGAGSKDGAAEGKKAILSYLLVPQRVLPLLLWLFLP